jgi:hypothetical protein
MGRVCVNVRVHPSIGTALRVLIDVGQATDCQLTAAVCPCVAKGSTTTAQRVCRCVALAITIPW